MSSILNVLLVAAAAARVTVAPVSDDASEVPFSIYHLKHCEHLEAKKNCNQKKKKNNLIFDIIKKKECKK